MAWHDRLLNVFRPDRLSRDLDAEIATHLGERTDDLMAGGMAADDAALEARRRFGNRGVQKDFSRDADSFAWLESIGADVRYAFRALRQSPGFTLVAVVSLALGIGANAAIFSLINALALRSLPVSRPDELMMVRMSGGHILTNPLWEQLRHQPSIFSSSLAYGGETFNLANGGEVQQAAGNWVSGSFFQMLGVRPAAGRLLLPADDLRGCAPIAVISAGFATRRFGGAENAVGKTLLLNGHSFPIAGVTDPAFAGVEVGQPTDVYAPLCSEAITTGQPDLLDGRSRWYLTVLARPHAGMATGEVSRRIKLLAPGIVEATLPAGWTGDHKKNFLKNTLDVEASPAGRSEIRQTYNKALLVLMAVSAAVLLIACANIANLLLARAATRQREMAIRLAIGAGRIRLMRQMLTESLVLSTAGALLGVLFARWASQLLVGFLSSRNSLVWLDLSIDGRVLAFTIAGAVVTGSLFGAVPAWRATRVDPQLAMKSGGRGLAGGDARQRIGRALVVGQVTLSLTLVASAALLVGSFQKLTTVDLGFRRDGVLLVEMRLTNTGFKDQSLVSRPLEVLRRVRQIPGVSTASLSYTTPIGEHGWNDVIVAPGFVPATLDDSLAWFNQVTDGYFATLRSRMIAGRDISPADIAEHRSVVVINQTMARRTFNTSSPLGRTFQTPMRTPRGDSLSAPREVVGVVEDAKYGDVDEVAHPTAYHPLGGGDIVTDNLSLEIRTARSVADVMAEVSKIAAAVSPAITLQPTTLAEQVSESLKRPRLLAMLSGFFGVLALVLAMIGLYGTIAYSVAQRRNEIGIRVALGAGKSRVLRMIVGEAGRIVGLGLLLGGVLTIASTRLLSSFLFGVSATDPATLATAAAALALTGIAAASVPAVRASRLDPMTALRQD